MVGLILAVVGTVVSAVGGAVRGSKERRAAQIEAQSQEDARVLQMAQQRLAERGQKWDEYTQAVLLVQQKAQKRKQIVTLLTYGLPLLAGVFLLVAVRMPKRKRKGRKK